MRRVCLSSSGARLIVTHAMSKRWCGGAPPNAQAAAEGAPAVRRVWSTAEKLVLGVGLGSVAYGIEYFTSGSTNREARDEAEAAALRDGLDKLRKVHGGTPHRDVGRQLHRVGVHSMQRGDMEGGVRALLDAAHVLRQLSEKQATGTALVDCGRCLVDLAAAQSMMSARDEALASLEEAAALRLKVVDANTKPIRRLTTDIADTYELLGEKEAAARFRLEAAAYQQ